MNGQARALIESMPNDIGTEAVGPLSFDEAFTLHHRAVFQDGKSCRSRFGPGRRRDAGSVSTTLSQSQRHAGRGITAGVAFARDS